MPGRPPKATKLHMIQGTGRAHRLSKREGEVQPAGSLPEAPEWLSEEARAEWARLTADNGYAACLTSVDRGMLAAYCHMWGEFVAGVILGQTPSATFIATMVNMAGKLGLDPSSRAKVKVPQQEKPANKFAALEA